MSEYSWRWYNMAKRWTDEEINFFKNNYSNHINLELSKIMNKTIGAIERHATIYQLKKTIVILKTLEIVNIVKILNI